MKHSIRMSNYQYSLLAEIINKMGGRCTLDWIAGKRQDTFGSFIRRGFLQYVPGKKERVVVATEDAYHALEAFLKTDTSRKIESSVLSVFFYRETGLKPPKSGASDRTQAVLAALKGK